MYIDLCNRCYRDVQDDLDVIERPDLEHDDEDYYEEGLDNEENLWYPISIVSMKYTKYSLYYYNYNIKNSLKEL